MKNIVLLSILLLCGCNHTYPQYPNSHTTQISSSDALQTVNHDGHEWVLANGYHCIALVHHPDCPCHEKEENAK